MTQYQLAYNSYLGTEYKKEGSCKASGLLTLLLDVITKPSTKVSY